MKVGKWSTTAANNNAAPPDGFPEGQAANSFNDCMREMMASLRLVFGEPQFFDSDITPTFVNATTFTVAGDQTAAIHSGRRVKCYDTNQIFATVTTASFTVVTTVQIAADSGSLTAALSAFGLGIFSRTLRSIPEPLSYSAAAVNCAATVSATSVNFSGTMSYTATVQGVPKAFISFEYSTTGIVTFAAYNCSVARVATGDYKITFTNPFADANYAPIAGAFYDVAGGGIFLRSAAAGSFEYIYGITGVAALDHTLPNRGRANWVFFR